MEHDDQNARECYAKVSTNLCACTAHTSKPGSSCTVEINGTHWNKVHRFYFRGYECQHRHV